LIDGVDNFTKRTYDASDRVTLETSSNSVFGSRSLEVNNLNAVSSDYKVDTVTDGDLSQQNDFDAAGNRVNNAVDAVGNRVRENGRYRYGYDAAGRRTLQVDANEYELQAASSRIRDVTFGGSGWGNAFESAGTFGPFNSNNLQRSTTTTNDAVMFNFHDLPKVDYDMYVLWTSKFVAAISPSTPGPKAIT
jgi:YD repeat-containing protein